MLHRTLHLNVLLGTTNTIKNSYVILNLESHESLWVMFIAKRNRMGGCGMDSSGSVKHSCEDKNEPFGSIFKYLLKKNSVPWSQLYALVFSEGTDRLCSNQC